ncbi:type III PLP-dependent enzyme [Paenibacillus polymyxa]|uniref:type III PLP-dependent enzyme n=1 Tax=Paenibacillus polymyxa TaxID=1406 RepID=UPI001BEBB689|nr:type III PLP-dependent enzyme [Paenibacillus polymyxa]MBT2282943.1 type III PLP-dependent enzyme [Paenibacillus polymyxa]
MKISNHHMQLLADEYSTPLFLYDGDFLKEHILNIQKLLHPAVEIFFSLKSNGSLGIASLINSFGCGIEVASQGELFLAIQAGYDSQDIVFSGPGKKPCELEYAIKQNIYCIITESLEELLIISNLAEEHNVIVPIGLRINPDSDLAKTSIKMAGVPRQFGVDENQIPLFLEEIKKTPNISFRGIHVYTGTQILDYEQIISTFSYTLKLAKYIKVNFGIECEMVDLGGGLGVPYFSHENELNLSALSSELRNLIDDYLLFSPKTRFILESGRYILAESGTYITKVLYKKHSKGEIFLVVDGGLNHHAAATFRGRTLRNTFPMILIKKDDLDPITTEKVSVVGPLCTPEDCLAKGIILPIAQPGDYLCIQKSGAYTLTYSPMRFLGHATPLELLVFNGETYIIREPGKMEDILRGQHKIIFQVGEYL